VRAAIQEIPDNLDAGFRRHDGLFFAWRRHRQNAVIPDEAKRRSGIQKILDILDSRFRGNDDCRYSGCQLFM
jgi:hypothetical protein